MVLYDEIKSAAGAIKTILVKNEYESKPKVGIVLGSGLGALVDRMKIDCEIPYTEIPNFPISTVKGHGGKLIYGSIAKKDVLVMSGRFHLYEGYTAQQITFPIRVMKELGITTLVITNAAGGLNRKFKAGDLMLIEDHVNDTNQNPLVGPNDDRLGERFLPMANAYDKELRKIAESVAKKEKIRLRKGIYIQTLGPNYETRAELKKFSRYGDAVGMSTVPEVIVAVHTGMKVLGISCITNETFSKNPPSHEEVIKVGKMASSGLLKLVEGILENI